MTRYEFSLLFLTYIKLLILPWQSINVIESPQLRNIFLMLREELRESDIPGRTTIRKRIEEVLDEHLDQLEKDLKVSSQYFVHPFLKLSAP